MKLFNQCLSIRHYWLLYLFIGLLPTEFLIAQKNKSKKINVLFIIVDDLRPELNCYGSTRIFSPNIDQLAARGVRFSKAYCQQAVCSPSRTSMFTGRRPDETKVYDLETHFRKNLPDVVTLPQWFKKNGYHTLGMGKVYHNLKTDDTASWSEPEWNPTDLIWNTNRGYLVKENRELAIRNGDGRGPAFEAGPDGSTYPDDWVVDSAIKKMRQLKEQPFFMAIGITKPHLPFNAPQRFWDMYDEKNISVPDTAKPRNSPGFSLANSGELRNYPGMPKGNSIFPDSLGKKLIHGYYACVSYMDYNVGRLLQGLKESGLEKNTVIVLLGDHGWKLGEYGEWCKHTNYEVDTRTPLIIAGPGVNKNKVSGSLVELLDLYPTLVKLCKLPFPSPQSGKSLLPLLTQNPNQRHKPYAVSQYPRGKLMGYSFRTENFRLVRWSTIGNPADIKALELYDHTNDPGELINRANDAAYKKQLNLLLKETDSFFNSHPGSQ
jgi:iduronate 2-sulfatase